MFTSTVFKVKIKVKYCALNPRDLQLIQGHVDEKTPFIPGYEVSGEIVERFKDDKETPFEIGDKVVALTKSSLGGLSCHCIADEKDVWKHNTLDAKVAAGLIVNYGHALLSLFRRAKIKKDTTVLVTSDSGGLGLAALDIAANVYKAKTSIEYSLLASRPLTIPATVEYSCTSPSALWQSHLGSLSDVCSSWARGEVVGVCGSEMKADVMREKGAWSALKMDPANMKASVQDITGGKGVDVVYDTVGRDFLKGAVHWTKGNLRQQGKRHDYTLLTEILTSYKIQRLYLSYTRLEQLHVKVLNTAISDHTEQICTINLDNHLPPPPYVEHRNMSSRNLFKLKALLHQQNWIQSTDQLMQMSLTTVLTIPTKFFNQKTAYISATQISDWEININSLVEFLTDQLEKGNTVTAFLLDYSKAFDCLLLD
ncbi:hypothetical protein J6590_010461 [Homalodisca vitripennis]|nr:hypothetical protein J6590_010461 [Homalodisca vitripennis]